MQLTRQTGNGKLFGNNCRAIQTAKSAKNKH